MLAVVSRQTVYRRLNEKELHARKPRIRMSLSAQHKRDRLNKCKEIDFFFFCENCPETQLAQRHTFECPSITTDILKLVWLPLMNPLREILYSPKAPKLAAEVVRTFDNIWDFRSLFFAYPWTWQQQQQHQNCSEWQWSHVFFTDE